MSRSSSGLRLYAPLWAARRRLFISTHWMHEPITVDVVSVTFMELASDNCLFVSACYLTWTICWSYTVSDTAHLLQVEGRLRPIYSRANSETAFIRPNTNSALLHRTYYFVCNVLQRLILRQTSSREAIITLSNYYGSHNYANPT